MVDRVWLYLVVSSDAQEESLPAQRRWGFEEAARIGAHVDPNGIFEGVATGKYGARTILVDLISRLQVLPKAQRPSRILMIRLDRAGRMPLDAISAINDLRKLGVIIRTRKDGDLTFARMIDMVGPMFDLMRAGFDNEVRSDMSKSGHRRRRDEGKLVPAKPPYGVVRDAKGYPAADRECAPIVREVFRRWIAGESPADLVVWLRSSAPPRRTTKGDIHLRWSIAHVYQMIHRCQTYRGVVVDEATWDAAQERRRKPSKPGPGGHVYPFSGIKCTCGETMRARVNSAPSRHVLKSGQHVAYARKKLAVWYVCQSMLHTDPGPRYRSVSEEKLEAAWLAWLRGYQLHRGDLHERSAPDHSGEIARLQRRLETAERRRERIHSAFEDGAYDGATMQKRLAVVEEEERECAAKIGALEAEQATREERQIARARAADLVRRFPALYEKADRAERARLNRLVFEIYGVPTVSREYAITLPSV